MPEDKSKKGSDTLLRNHAIMTLQDAKNYLHKQEASLPIEKGRRIYSRALSMDDFWDCPGARGRHQAYPGGLAIHTAQVMCTALDTLHHVAGAREDDVKIAVVWHDWAKIEMYKEKGADDGAIQLFDAKSTEYEYTALNETIGHLPLSAIHFYNYWEKYHRSDLTEERMKFILHLMLAHHGRLEWQSPVEPKCAEAWAIHTADMMSSQYITDKNPC